MSFSLLKDCSQLATKTAIVSIIAIKPTKPLKNFSSQPQNIYAQIFRNFHGFFSSICAQLAQIASSICAQLAQIARNFSAFSAQFLRIFSAIFAQILRKFCIFSPRFSAGTVYGLHSYYKHFL